MKKALLSAVIAVILFMPVTCFSSYLIKLENGGEFVTDQYWEEDNHIRFYSYGGLVDLPKSDVRAITESERAAPEESVYKSDSIESSSIKTPVETSVQSIPENTADTTTEKPMDKIQTKNKQSVTTEKAVKNQEIDVQYYKDKKAKLQARMDTSLQQLREATRNRDVEGKEKAREEVRKLSGEIYKLTDEVKDKNNGELPENWW